MNVTFHIMDSAVLHIFYPARCGHALFNGTRIALLLSVYALGIGAFVLSGTS